MPLTDDEREAAATRERPEPLAVLLYDSPPSGNCYKARLLLSQLGIPFERRTVDTRRRDDRGELLGDKNPALRVPVLELEDGRHLAESNAILWYLADGTAYLSGDPFERAKTLQWMFFEQYDHEPNIAVVRHRTMLGHLDEHADSEVRRERGYAALAAMEKHLDGFELLVGERYSIADISLYAYTHVADEGGFDLSGYPAIRAWLDRVSSQPGHITIND
jgi:glutathione S-transferase